MNKIIILFKKWIKDVKYLGSLEEARKKGLDPFKNSDYKWRFCYFEKEEHKSILYTIFFS